MATLSDWRAQVDKELAGAAGKPGEGPARSTAEGSAELYDKLVTPTPEGFAIQPLYTERTAEGPYARGYHRVEGLHACWRRCGARR